MVRFSLILTALLMGACGDDDGSGTTVDGPGGGGDAPATVDGAGADGATTTDGGVVIPADGGVGEVPCGAAGPCTDGQECCVERMGMNEPQFSCIDPGGTCQGNTFGCDGPEDCEAGQHCCGSIAGGLSAECQPLETTCEGAELCHSPAECTGEGDMCCALPFGGVGVCNPTCGF